MNRLLNSRKTLIVLTIVVAFVAVAVPTCQMVDCNMEMGYMPFMHGQADFNISSMCGGEWVASQAPNAIVPAGADSLVLALVSAVVAAVLMLRPQLVAGSVRIEEFTPPPPPEEPRGERFRV
jgi:ABC-type antimicrobial peptide transport system permease subunit